MPGRIVIHCLQHCLRVANFNFVLIIIQNATNVTEVSYVTAQSPIPDISFLNKQARDVCQGISVYWMYSKCDDSSTGIMKALLRWRKSVKPQPTHCLYKYTILHVSMHKHVTMRFVFRSRWHHHHHHHFNVHFLLRLIKGMDGCFQTAWGGQPAFSVPS